MSQERTHSLLGGSSADRWASCPGSVALEATCEKKVAGPDADLGTLTHEYLLDKSLKSFLDHKIHGTQALIEGKDDAMLEIIAKAIEVIWEKVLFESITDKTYGIEHKFYLSKELDSFGYVDFWAVYIDDKGKKAGIIYDYKNGFHSVDVDKNAQLAFYACALQNMLMTKGKSLDYVRGIIYQPRITHEEPYKETKFTASQLETWNRKFLKSANDIVTKKSDKLKAGSWCKWCRAQGKCPAYKKELSKISSLKLLDDDIELEVFPLPETIPDEEVARIVMHWDKIKKFGESVKEYAMVRNLAGNPIIGTKCVESRKRRRWITNHIEVATVLREQGYQLEEVFTLKPKGITVIEKMLADKTSKNEAKSILENLTELGNSSIQLVSDADPRPAIEGSEHLLITNEIDND